MPPLTAAFDAQKASSTLSRSSLRSASVVAPTVMTPIPDVSLASLSCRCVFPNSSAEFSI